MNLLSVFELDGTSLWSFETQDELGLGGPTAYDFDLDGQFEIIHTDSNTFRIFDGANGDVLFETDEHASTKHSLSTPQVRDLDNDGFVEVIVRTYDWPSTGEHGLSVFSTKAQQRL